MWTFGILTFCSVLFAHSLADELPECGIVETFKLSTECVELALEFQKAELKYEADKNPDSFAKMSAICDQTRACLSSLKCKRAANVMKIMGDTCSDLNFFTDDNQKCATAFFMDAALARYTNVSSCLKDYEFLEENLLKRKKAYIEGKECFLGHAKKVCTDSAYEPLALVYDDFVAHVSTKPEFVIEECDAAFHDFNVIRCKAITVGTLMRMQDAAKFMPNPDDPVVLVILRMCLDVKKCLDDPCVADKDTHGGQTMKNCQKIEDALKIVYHGEL